VARRSETATIAEVAEHAGVSPATVSRVFNNRFVGDPAVAERVRASAVELSYTPNHHARSLALGRTRAIAFVVPDLANPAFQAILSSLSKSAARDGYRVLVADSVESPDDEPSLVDEVRRRCDAVVLCAPRMPDDELVRHAASLRPLVLINRAMPQIDAPSLAVSFANSSGNTARSSMVPAFERVLILIRSRRVRGAVTVTVSPSTVFRSRGANWRRTKPSSEMTCGNRPKRERPSLDSANAPAMRPVSKYGIRDQTS